MEQSSTDPIQYPTVNLGGKKVEVKFRCGDIIRLKKTYGVELEKVDLKGADAIERAMILLAVGVHHAMPDVTPDSVADLVDLSQLKGISEAIAESIKKALPPQETGATNPPSIQ